MSTNNFHGYEIEHENKMSQAEIDQKEWTQVFSVVDHDRRDTYHVIISNGEIFFTATYKARENRYYRQLPSGLVYQSQGLNDVARGARKYKSLGAAKKALGYMLSNGCSINPKLAE